MLASQNTFQPFEVSFSLQYRLNFRLRKRNRKNFYVYTAAFRSTKLFSVDILGDAHRIIIKTKHKANEEC